VENFRACVVFDSRFGSTEKIARSMESGIQEAGIQCESHRSTELTVESLRQFDLICIGGPTEAFSASKPMKDFLKGLSAADLAGKRGFAFDTRIDWRLSGSAAKFIEKELQSLGLRIIHPRESAIVSTTRNGGEIAGAVLKEGEELRFQKVGRQVGEALLASVRPVSSNV
jgi:flavodoxin